MSIENEATLGRANEIDGPSGWTQLSDTTPVRLIQSTGNLYWSSNPPVFFSAPEVQVSAPTIYSASKSSQPGEEVALYTEQGTGEFGALTFAKVGDEFYGYFVANYAGQGQIQSQIKRIPLGAVTPSGQAKVLLDPAPATIGLGDLVTDGSFLCWADSEGIRSMPIGGGPVTMLAAVTEWAHLSVLGRTLYYTDGGTIYSVPTGGGTPSVVWWNPFLSFTALYVLEEPRVTALAERPGIPGPPPVQNVVVVLGTTDGGVFGMVLGGTGTTYQAAAAGTTTVSSIYSAGGRVIWSEQVSSGAVQVLMSYGGVTTTLSSKPALYQNWDLMCDEAAAYWAYGYVEKYTF